MKVGIYWVEMDAALTTNGRYQGYVRLIWDDAGSLKSKTVYFAKEFATSAEALQHAAEQAQIRIKAGVL